MTATINRY